MSIRLDIKEIHNIRDLGGEVTKEGKRIIPGKLIRSGKLEKVPEEILHEQISEELFERDYTIYD